jgi:hypothetical protein
MEAMPHPSLSVPDGSFSLLIAPETLLLPVIEARMTTPRQRLLYICGNYSRFLSRIDRCCSDFAVRRAFTVHQLFTILDEADESLIILEHDGSLYDDANEAVGHVGMACRDRARTATVIVLAPALDPVMRRLAGDADRVVCIEACEPRPVRQDLRRHQTHLEV